MAGTLNLDLVNSLKELKGSTTFFLESLANCRLNVLIESQKITDIGTASFIERIVRLYFDNPQKPLLYCVSYLKKDALTNDEFKALFEGGRPIGEIFHSLNKNQTIEKRNASIQPEEAREIASLLNVKSSTVIKKQYDYWVAGRNLGYICEYFNEESISRYVL